MFASERSPLASKRRPAWLATAIGISIFLVLSIVCFTLLAFLAPPPPTPGAFVLRDASAMYAPWLTSAS